MMTITKSYKSRHSATKLFEAWVSPKATIHPVVKIEVEPTVNGHLRLHAESENGIFIMSGTFIELVSPDRLKYTWNWEGTDETTTVTVDFKNVNGGTEISLTHEGFESEDSRARHDAGWDSYFEGLEKLLSK